MSLNIKQKKWKMFGDFVKELRSRQLLGLREFCFACDCDPSNWSKVERGLLPPPQSQLFLKRVCRALRLSAQSAEGKLVFDYAAIGVGRIPRYVLEDDTILKRLPLFFRTARTVKSEQQTELEQLARILIPS